MTLLCGRATAGPRRATWQDERKSKHRAVFVIPLARDSRYLALWGSLCVPSKRIATEVSVLTRQTRLSGQLPVLSPDNARMFLY